MPIAAVPIMARKLIDAVPNRQGFEMTLLSPPWTRAGQIRYRQA
jgi:hypothetical protein